MSRSLVSYGLMAKTGTLFQDLLSPGSLENMSDLLDRSLDDIASERRAARAADNKSGNSGKISGKGGGRGGGKGGSKGGGKGSSKGGGKGGKRARRRGSGRERGGGKSGRRPEAYNRGKSREDKERNGSGGKGERRPVLSGADLDDDIDTYFQRGAAAAAPKNDETHGTSGTEKEAGEEAVVEDTAE